jgi:ABC-type uncharacterized transport system fused permease/ATPase subunit
MSSTSKTLEELFCESHKITGGEFRKQVFWQCLYRRAVPVAPFILLFNAGYFAPDRELISSISRARTLGQVAEELRDFVSDPQNIRGLRKRAKIRISAHRVLHLAGRYLAR